MTKEIKYHNMGGSIVFPWSDEREELGEYILRANREVADRITTMLNETSVMHSIERDNLTGVSFLNVPKMRRFLLLEKKIIYLNNVLGRIWKEHEEFEDELMRR